MKDQTGSIRLIACDLDGTLLLNGAQQLQPDTCRLIRRLKEEKNILFCAASGRQYANLRRLFAPVQDEISYLCENGCLCYVNGELIHKEQMDRNLGQELLKAILETDGAEALLSCENTHYIQPKDVRFENYMRNVVRNDITVIPDILNTPEAYLKVSLFEKGGLHDTDKWKERFGRRCTVVTGGSEWLDMMPQGINKASGLQHILSSLGISASECMAIGDNDNDREMLELAGFPAAVRSAKPSIRALAKTETDTVEHLLEQILSGHPIMGHAFMPGP